MNNGLQEEEYKKIQIMMKMTIVIIINKKAIMKMKEIMIIRMLVGIE